MATGPLARLRIEQRDGITVAGIDGEIDLSNAAELEMSISQAVPNDALALVVDLAEVRYLDSSGVSLLFNLARRVARRQQQYVVVAPGQANVRQILSLTGATDSLPLGDSLGEALGRIEAPPEGPG